MPLIIIKGVKKNFLQSQRVYACGFKYNIVQPVLVEQLQYILSILEYVCGCGFVGQSL